MPLRYPRSFFMLLSVGFLLAVLPLAGSLVADTVAIERLASQSRQAVFDAARIARGSRQLADSVNVLERSALQAIVLNDDDLWQAYRTRHQEFSGRIDALRKLPLDAGTRELLESLASGEAGIDGKIEAAAGSRPSAAQVTSDYANVFDLSRQLLANADSAIDREAEALHGMATQTESRAWLQLAVAVPVALGLVAGFTHLLTRPITQLDAGIRGLGERRFERKIEVHGPGDLEQLGERLDWLRLRLSQLEEQKSRFLRHVSHELKTPLTALREGSDLLAEGAAGPLAPRQREIVDILRDNSAQLQRLIENLLRHGESEFRETGLRIQPVQPARLIAEVAEGQRIAIEARRLQLRQAGGAFTMQSDPDRLRVVLDNLLSNAVRYSPEGGKIEVSAAESGGLVRLRVLDEGPGVDAADKPHVFDAFYRGAAPPRGAVKGSGLGLSICRDHVEALGGTIEIGDGRGDFTVILPKGEA